jgi:hypothetical protein
MPPSGLLGRALSTSSKIHLAPAATAKEELEIEKLLALTRAYFHLVQKQVRRPPPPSSSSSFFSCADPPRPPAFSSWRTKIMQEYFFVLFRPRTRLRNPP